MSKIGKISVIPKNYSKGHTLESALADHNMTRYPGTGVTIFPFRENDGSYRTALDPECVIYLKIEDKQAREAAQKGAQAELDRLQKITKLKLDARSDFYNYGKFGRRDATGAEFITISPYKLQDGDNIFNLDDPHQAITFAWLRVHPRIASSLDAWNNGDYPSDVVFYVKDEAVEDKKIYEIKKEYSDAVIKFDSLSLERRRKIARLCDLPVTEDSREETVYNLMSDFLNKREIDRGAFKGQNSIKVFNTYASLDDDSLYIKDLINTAFTNNLFVIKKGSVYEGQQEIFSSKDELTETFLDKKNQDKVLALEKKLKLKKLASV
jgi:hypothetical protein